MTISPYWRGERSSRFAKPQVRKSQRLVEPQENGFQRRSRPQNYPRTGVLTKRGPFSGSGLPRTRDLTISGGRQGHRPEALAFSAGAMTNGAPFRGVRRAGRPKGVARSAVRRGGPCGPPLLMRSLPQLCLCGFLRNPLHGFQSEPFSRPARHRARPTAAAKGKSPEGLFPKSAALAAFAPGRLAAFAAAHTWVQRFP